MNNLLFFFVAVAFLAIGDVISTKTKAYVPSIFVTAVCFLIGFWTFLPKDIAIQVSFGKEFVMIGTSLLLVHLGTLMSLNRLLNQWRAVLIALAGVCGTIGLAMTLGVMFFGYQTVVAIVPPLTGGVVATLMMSQALTAKGLTALVAYPVAMLVMHSFIGYPITSWCLKKEAKRLLKGYQASERDDGPETRGDGKKIAAAAESIARPTKLIPPLPEDYLSPYLILGKLMVVAILAAWLAGLMHGAINQYVICLVLGVIFCQVGFLEENSMGKAGVMNWLIMGLLVFLFSQLSNVTPQILLSLLIPTVTLIFLGIFGMFAASVLVGRFTGYSREMSFACALTALFGFPADYVITMDVCKSIGQTEEEETYLADILLPRMLVGGFATVSVASVVIAGIFINLL